MRKSSGKNQNNNHQLEARFIWKYVYMFNLSKPLRVIKGSP